MSHLHVFTILEQLDRIVIDYLSKTQDYVSNDARFNNLGPLFLEIYKFKGPKMQYFRSTIFVLLNIFL